MQGVLIEAQNPALNSQVRLLMEPHLHESKKQLAHGSNVKKRNKLQLWAFEGLNTRPVLQISEDLVDGKSPTACMDKFARQMLSNRSENSLKLI